MNEKPIERLNYYNGQRLEAAGLKLEQEYHIRVRRWLNKSLFSAGIAEGLEVLPELDKNGKSTNAVIVRPGLALDEEGRELILLEEKVVPVIGKPSPKLNQVDGNYLYIQYHEETRAEESDGCIPRGNGKNKGQLPWGGPSRVRATPILDWSDVFPHESSGKIVLAQVELDDKCNVRNIYGYPRHYAGPSLITTVRQYALEGERHIDKDNPGRIYFHIRGRQPNAVTLYLRAEQFSTLYYTEMGEHKHNIHVSVNSLTIPAHLHSMPTSTSGSGTAHTHTVSSVVADADTSIWGGVFGAIGAAATLGVSTAPMAIPLAAEAAALFARNALLNAAPMALTLSPRPFRDRAGADTTQPNLGVRVGMSITINSEPDPKHTHPIPGSTEYYPNNATPTTYPLSGSGYSDPSGVTDPAPPDYTAHDGAPLSFVNHLQVYIGEVDEEGLLQPAQNFTAEIITQLKNLQPTVDWADVAGNAALGDGTSGHALAQQGTGAIALNLLSPQLSFPMGQYYIELRAPIADPSTGQPFPDPTTGQPISNNGGRILYNLYVE